MWICVFGHSRTDGVQVCWHLCSSVCVLLNDSDFGKNAKSVVNEISESQNEWMWILYRCVSHIVCLSVCLTSYLQLLFCYFLSFCFMHIIRYIICAWGYCMTFVVIDHCLHGNHSAIYEAHSQFVADIRHLIWAEVFASLWYTVYMLVKGTNLVVCTTTVAAAVVDCRHWRCWELPSMRRLWYSLLHQRLPLSPRYQTYILLNPES